MGVIVKFIRGKWYVFVNYRGRRKSKAIGTKERAEQVAEKLRVAFDLYGQEAFKILEAKPKQKKLPTVEAYSVTWLAEIEKTDLRLTTRTGYKIQLTKHLVPVFGATALDKVTYSDVKAFAIEKSKKYSYNSVRLQVATLRCLLNEAVREGIVPINPIANVSVARFYGSDRPEEIDPFTIEELHKIEAKCLERYPAYYEFVLCLARTGLRIGEAIALQWRDIDFEARTIFVRRNMPDHREIEKPKTPAGKRKVDMSPELAAALQALRARRKKEYLAEGHNEIPEWVFCTIDGTPLHHGNFRRRVWAKVQGLAKVRARTPHDLRHTWASQKMAQGEDLGYIARQLGHAKLTTTLSIYGHWIAGTKRVSEDSLDRAQAKSKNEVRND